MFDRVRRAAYWVVALSFAMSGFSYAGTGAPDPVGAVIDGVSATFSEPQTTEVTEPDASPSPEPEVSPDPEPADVPPDEDEGNGVERVTEGCPDGFSGNHGAYVSSVEDRPRSEAAKSDCGKPVNSVESDEPDEPEATSSDTPDDEPRAGHVKAKGKGHAKAKGKGHAGDAPAPSADGSS